MDHYTECWQSYPSELHAPSISGTETHPSGTLPWADEAFLGQLHRKPPCDALQLLHRILGVVDFDSSLCASERNIDHGTLEGHEHCQRLHLILCNMRTVAHTSWGGGGGRGGGGGGGRGGGEGEGRKGGGGERGRELR